MKSIKIHDKAYVQGLGHRVNRNCRGVGVRELNMTFDSVTETAERLGVTVPSVCYALRDPLRRTVAGVHVYYVKELTEHFDEVLEFNRNESEKKDKQLAEMEMENAELRKEAALWRAHVAEQEAIRKAKEMEHARLRKANEDAKAERERLNAILLHLDREMQNTVAAIMKAEEEENKTTIELANFESKMKED